MREGASTELLEVNDDEELFSLLEQRGLGDGLPVVAPTEGRIAAMLRGYRADPAAVLGDVAPKYGIVTMRGLAACAVMAGCMPAYLPVVAAAVAAVMDPAFNLNGIQSTTHPCAPLIVVNGPITERIGMNSSYNAFGQGNRANATIGRALRLALLAFGGARPGNGDMATLGHPGKYTYCIAENAAESPWPSFSQSQGFEASEDVVTVLGAEAPQNVNDHESKSGLGILRMIAGTMRSTGINNCYYRDGQVMVVMSPEHARTIAGDGYSREGSAAWLFSEARVPVSYFSVDNIRQRLQTRFPEEFGEYGAHTTVPVVHSADNILICVVGGPGKHSMFIPTFGGTRSVSRRVGVDEWGSE
ncbi:MAG: hypothetical protein ACYDC5_01720 [Candidatus Dormibacteria bacterium]